MRSTGAGAARESVGTELSSTDGMHIKRILAPTDFAPQSRAAVDHALQLASVFGAQVDVLHVWALPVDVLPEWVVHEPGEAPQAITALMRARAEAKMEGLVRELREKGETVHGRLEMGDVASVIVETAKRDHYDLVVMRTHGRTGFKRMWSGSIAEEVVRLCSTPVLTLGAAAAIHA